MGDFFMFITITKKQIVFALVFVLVLFLVLGIALIRSSTTTDIRNPGTAGENTAMTKKVIIDSGHGGEDGGAVSPNGTMEKDINLNIAMLLGQLLEKDGMEVVYTRTDDRMLGAGDGALRNRKVADLKERLRIIEENSDSIFVSIHLNKFSQESVRGAQVFYSGNHKSGAMLAKKIQETLIDLNEANNRICKEADKNIYLLEHATIPAVIVECGFLSNAEDEALLKSENYQKELAQSVYSGIKSYYTLQRK